MRLTCPNCGAQYEVPDEVIPVDGRDVQCSNCGDTWFQEHPDNPVVEQKAAAEVDDGPADMPSDPTPAPAPEVDIAEPDSQPPEPPKHPEVDPGIADILRQEAEREAQLRAAEASEPLESQPELGLDEAPGAAPDDEQSRRAREARDRMARMRGQEPVAETDPGSRRGLLPDIEEINSTLRASSEDVSAHSAIGPALATDPAQRRGFVRGFALIVIIGVILVLIYANAPKIAQAVPQVDPLLSSYVSMVDQARMWLDARLSQYLPKP